MFNGRKKSEQLNLELVTNSHQ